MIHQMKPIYVWEKDSRKRTLSDVEGAARFLVESWPDADAGSPLRKIAQEEALRVLEEGGEVWPFRSLMEHAASAAGILAEPDRRPSTKLPGHIARPWDFRKRGRRS